MAMVAFFLYPGHIDDIRHIQQYHRVFKKCCDQFQILLFLCSQAVTAFFRSIVFILPRGSPDHINGFFGFSAGGPDDFLGQIHILLIPGFSGPNSSAVVGRVCLPPVFVDRHQLLVDTQIRIFTESVHQIFGVWSVDSSAGTGSAAIKVELDPSEDGDTFSVDEG